MKTRSILITVAFAWMLVIAGPVAVRAQQGLTTADIYPDKTTKAELQSYSPDPFQPAPEIGISRWNSYRKADYGRTRGGNILRGFGIGLGVGAAGGGLIGAVIWTECTDEGFLACMMHPESRGEAFLVGAVLGGVAGGITGIIAGAFSKTGKRRGDSVIIQLDVIPGSAENFSLNPAFSVNLPIKSKR